MNVIAKARTESLQATKHPLFNDRKLKFGTFCSNLSGGCAISKIDGVLKARWPETLELAQLAEAMDFEALVPVGRWKGFGGPTNFNGEGFESFSWASAIAASTENAGVFATTHVPTIHPIFAAKMGTTIDHVSNGRFALNIVTGWFKPEIEMFGRAQLAHEDRYKMAAEWLEVVKRLWTEDKEFDYEGQFYQIKAGWCAPKPLHKPYPPIMNAGGSEVGRHYAAKHCDVAFVVFTTHDKDEMRKQVAAYRDLARQEYGRELKIWGYAYVVQGETEKEARDFYNYYVHEQGDWEAATNLLDTMGLNAQTLPKEAYAWIKEHFIAGWGGYPIVGTKEQVVDKLQLLSDIGLDGTLLSWARYAEGMREFQEKTYPLVVQAGLR
ncbi:MAG TPA: LLM class flavin-dependent oxidoreductase [Beijerinckiaceae bacterium]|jgi:alkanesulfonate monooxygenase SsuD/methylene tetrahydromethanopterin reductase-like flavin-dependent oxidoreductase (luciferase family)|nr:LLM class flavin-dependent oxidoreductase [Beijerinckiaceae bacterium]